MEVKTLGVTRRTMGRGIAYAFGPGRLSHVLGRCMPKCEHARAWIAQAFEEGASAASCSRRGRGACNHFDGVFGRRCLPRVDFLIEAVPEEWS